MDAILDIRVESDILIKNYTPSQIEVTSGCNYYILCTVPGIILLLLQ